MSGPEASSFPPIISAAFEGSTFSYGFISLPLCLNPLEWLSRLFNSLSHWVICVWPVEGLKVSTLFLDWLNSDDANRCPQRKIWSTNQAEEHFEHLKIKRELGQSTWNLSVLMGCGPLSRSRPPCSLVSVFKPFQCLRGLNVYSRF